MWYSAVKRLRTVVIRTLNAVTLYNFSVFNKSKNFYTANPFIFYFFDTLSCRFYFQYSFINCHTRPIHLQCSSAAPHLESSSIIIVHVLLSYSIITPNVSFSMIFHIFTRIFILLKKPIFWLTVILD